MNDYSTYIIKGDNWLHIYDEAGVLTTLPEDFLADFSEIESLEFSAKALLAIPNSIKSMEKLKHLSIRGTKIKQLPTIDLMPKEIESIRIWETNLIDLNKEITMLCALSKLKSLNIGGYKGRVFPECLKLITQLKKLAFGRDLKNKIDVQQLFVFLQMMPWLEQVTLDFKFDKNLYNEDFIKLDFLKLFNPGYEEFFYYPERSPLIFGKLNHMFFNENMNPFQEVLNIFREYCANKKLNDTQRQILFGLQVKNFTALKSFFSDILKNNNGAFKRICLHTKPKGESIKTINEKLNDLNLKVGKDIRGEDVIHVIGPDNNFLTTSVLIEENQKIITIDQLQEFLIKIENPWLIQEENKEVNEQLLQLLTSNQPENYLIAFQIIDGGGANKEIQSLLAAIMTTHPDKHVFKAAEKLYLKYGSPIYKNYYDSLKISLRMSSHTASKLLQAVNHPDIDPIIFRLMHHLIAGNNPQIKDVISKEIIFSNVSFSEFPELITHFGGIKTIVLDTCKELNLERIFATLKKMDQLCSLSINSSHIPIHESISLLTQLQELNIVQNELPNPACLGALKKLKTLNIEGVKIKDWSWLKELTGLYEINISSTGCSDLPKEIFNLLRLDKIEAKHNKITSVDTQFSQLENLYYLDLSNNQLSEFPYSLFKTNKLTTLLLRSNKIEVFDADKLMGFSGTENAILNTLNLSRNKLVDLTFKDIDFRSLSKLDISHNVLSNLDRTIFTNTSLSELYASNNQISEIPEYISRSFQNLQLQNNKIQILPAFFAHVTVRNCDLSNNLIKEIHTDFKNIGNGNYQRLYWKINNNPIKNYYFGR